MSNTLIHAQKELEILVKSHQDPENRPLIEPFIPELLALVKKFGESGQSGGSATYTARSLSKTIENLCLQKTISPIMGTDDEWNDVSKMSDEPKGTIYQNNRDGGVFKEVRNGKEKYYYIDAIINVIIDYNVWGSFWLSREDCLTGNKNLMIGSIGYIKSFPFIPKTFYIDVQQENPTYDTIIKDIKQMEEVSEYYDIDHPYFNRKKKLKRILGLK